MAAPQPKRSLRSNPDLFVAGGGPAGLSCAIAAAMLGLTVEVADGLAPPIDKPCGEGLLPDSLSALSALGVDPSSVDNAPLRGVRFVSARHTTQAEFPDGLGRGVRRNLLHQLLLDRAAALGVRFQWRTVVRSLTRGKVETNRGIVRPRWIVGADGHGSRVRAAAGLDRGKQSSRRIGLQQHFAVDPWTEHVEVYWGHRGQAYVTPVSPGEVCVIVLGREKLGDMDAALKLYPQLAQRLSRAARVGPTRGAMTMNRRLHRVAAANVALIGDASGSVDAVTGEGLGLCFRQAVALAAALRTGELALYETAHRSIARLPTIMSRTMLLLDRSSLLRETALAALSWRPGVFQRLLEIHLGGPQLQREHNTCPVGSP